MVWAYSPDASLAAMAAIRRGKISLGGEFGGMGSVTRSGVAIVERGVRNLLAHAGIIDRKHAKAPPEPTRFVEVKNRDYYVYATEPGLFEPAVELGDRVREGQLAGEVHFVDNPAREPVQCHFRTDGMVLCKRHFGRVERGDCVAHLATDWKG
jgi:predicted deacylase